MKRTINTTWVLCIAFSILSLNSHSENIVISYEGPIEGLVFDFGPGLPVTLPGIGSFTAEYAEVDPLGREHIVITSSGQYNYHAKLGEGMIYVTTSEYGEIEIPMECANLDEHFTIEGEIPDDPLDVVVPDDVDLYFRATLITEAGSVNLQLKIKNGNVQFIRP